MMCVGKQTLSDLCFITDKIWNELQEPRVRDVVNGIRAELKRSPATYCFENYFGHSRFLKPSYQQKGDPKYKKPEGTRIPNQSDFYMERVIKPGEIEETYAMVARTPDGHSFDFMSVALPNDAYSLATSGMDRTQASLQSFRRQASRFDICAEVLQLATISRKLDLVALRNIVKINDDADQQNLPKIEQRQNRCNGTRRFRRGTS